MSFNVSVFSQINDSEIDVFIYSDVDISALKVLYSNCIRIGNIDNSNIHVATIHPDLWFSNLYSLFSHCLSVVPRRPTYSLIFFEEGQIMKKSLASEVSEFESDEDLEHFFKETCKFKNISLFSICKFIDLSTLKSRWSIRYNDITNTSILRNNKIDSLINI
jgi:hypothetical protein